MDYDLIVVGSGAAGLSAAVYGQRYNMKTLVMGEEFGGETAAAGAIENWPGDKQVDGLELVQRMKAHAEHTGAEVKDGKVVKIAKEEGCFKVSTEAGEEYRAHAVILAIGSKRRHLGLAREKELTGRGVHYCVTCDGPVYSGRKVIMVGGGDSSVKGVNFLAEYVEKIYFITREKEPHAEPVNRERMKQLGDKVEVLAETEVRELVGEKKLEKVVLSRPYQGSAELAADGLFVEIGFEPDQTFAEQLGLETDERGYLKADNMMKTNVPGVFAAGDATNHFGAFKQDITASALGTVAATSAYEYHTSGAEPCRLHERAIAPS